jgi:hypothetical protein
VRIDAFYMKNAIFRNVNQFFDSGAACRLRRDHRGHLRVICEFFPKFQVITQVSSCTASAEILKTPQKRSYCNGIRFRYDVIVRHTNYSYGLKAASLRPLGLKNAARRSSLSKRRMTAFKSNHNPKSPKQS